MENGLVDSTIVRAHASAAGAQKNGDQADQTLGRSRGGFSTKIHVTTDGLGYPLRLALTADQRHDLIKAYDMIVDLDFDYIIADRSYSAQDFRNQIIANEMEPVIPSKQNARATDV